MGAEDREISADDLEACSLSGSAKGRIAIKHSKIFSIAAALTVTAACLGQEPAFKFSSSVPVAVPVFSEAPAVVKAARPVPARAWESKLDRWLDVKELSYANRYRSTFDDNGARSFSQGQQRILAGGTLKLDSAGRYGVGFHLSSGRYFNWAYADFMGGGQRQFLNNAEAKMSPFQLYLMNIVPIPAGFFNSGGGQLYLRQLFLTAEPVRGITAEFGGFAINHGVNSEATSYDDDGYMSGERLTIKRPKQLWLSEVSYTRGYLGELYTPNFFARGDKLSKSNYWQILGRKDFGKRLSVSTDYTYATPEGSPFHLKTTREALLVDVHESRVFDKVRFEAYQRINGGQYAPGFPFPSGKGYVLTAGKSLRRASFEGGFAAIDPDYINNLGVNVQALVLGLAVNGDQYGVGNRYFVRPTIPLTSSLSLVAAYSKVFDDTAAKKSNLDIWNAQNLTAGVVFDAKKLLFRKSAVK